MAPGGYQTASEGPVLVLSGAPLPLAGRARIYACGITPYDVTHLGHAATFVWVDTLARVLTATGTDVVACRNVTDVDDVLLAAANRARLAVRPVRRDPAVLLRPGYGSPRRG